MDGAEPGDIPKVTMEAFHPSGFGWTANIPGFGLLADQFEAPHLKVRDYDADALSPALFSDIAQVPPKPFAGTVGLAPPEAGLHSVVPPRRMGGNLDIRDLVAGTVLYLPVEAAGALFSIGDTHSAQGDGEVCGTAIESPMDVEVTRDLIKQERPASPRFTAPGPVTRHLDAKGYEVTTGIGPDMMAGARDAVSAMVDLLVRQHGLSSEDAYLLCSVAGDLRISEIVDRPNWVVSFYVPRLVFEGAGRAIPDRAPRAPPWSCATSRSRSPPTPARAGRASRWPRSRSWASCRSPWPGSQAARSGRAEPSFPASGSAAFAASGRPGSR